MKTRHVIAIGILSAITIGLIAFGLKTKNFKKPILTNAEDYMPVSTHWMLNNPPTATGEISQTTLNTPNFTDSTNSTYNQIYIRKANSGSAYNWNYIKYTNTNTNGNKSIYSYGGNGTTSGWINPSGAVINFETTPDGNTVNILSKIGQPIYNNNAIIIDNHSVNQYGDRVTYDSCIYQIRKSNIIIDNFSLIHTDGTITIYIDQGCQTLSINGTSYNDFNSNISLTNKDIYITTTGTPVGTVGYTFTIHYFNTLPVIEPEPLPDASEQTIEVIPIVPMMFQILTMPFTFITTAFNVTLWEGTPYQFNFSNFIYSLIAIATLIFIIKLFTSGFSVIGNYTYNKADKDFKKSQTRLNNAKARNIERNVPKKTESKVTIKKE